MNFILILFTLTQFCALAYCYKILSIFPHPSRSHVNVFYPVVEGLAQKGHHVTFISHYKYPNSLPNLRQLQLKSDETELLASIDMKWMKGYRYEKYITFFLLAFIGQQTCRDSFSDQVFKDLIASKDEYDLVLLEFFNSDCLVPFAHKFGAHLIGLSSCTIMPWSNGRFGNNEHPAYIPVNLLDYSDKMNFLERVENTVLQVFAKGVYSIINYLDNRIVRENFNDLNMPPVQELAINASLFLVNSHFSLNLPRPAVPAVIDIGGVHIKKGQLSQELDKWINKSTHGVIYFSLGSMIKGHTFPVEKRNAFLNAFARLPQRVLWKYENETMPNQPDNVRIQKWMPQLDILCHPNVRAFIAHGGLLGTIEAVHCGVPMIVMPQYGDQHTNAKALEANGGGVILQLQQATEEKVYEALQAVLAPRFRTGAKELSARFRDRPMPPLETAIYWIEYVARHRGAHHMRTAAVDMPFYQYLLLDVILFLLLVSLISVSISFYILRAIYRKIVRQKVAKIKTN